jgi:site-specific recombinase XerD
MNQIVDMEYIKFDGKGKKERKVYLSDKFKPMFQEYLKDREIELNKKGEKSDYLLLGRNGNKFSNNAIENIVKKYGKIAGIRFEDISPHVLRHTAATLKYKYGKVDIRGLQVYLGHSKLDTTQIYVDVDEEQMKKTANSFSVVGL